MTVDVRLTVDARNLSCPLPIVRTAIAIKELMPGDTFEVLATDPGSTMDFVAWSRTTGNALLDTSVADGVYRFVLRRK
jgi:TusA-related sulfurtransferase